MSSSSGDPALNNENVQIDYTQFFEAVAEGNMSLLKAFVGVKNVSILQVDGNGQTALQIAEAHNQEDAKQFLHKYVSRLGAARGFL